MNSRQVRMLLVVVQMLLCGVMGGFIGALADIHWTDWQFYVLLGVFTIYGLVCYSGGTLREA